MGIWGVATGEGKGGGSLMNGWSGICPRALKSLLCLLLWGINGFWGHAYCQRRGGGSPVPCRKHKIMVKVKGESKSLQSKNMGERGSI